MVLATCFACVVWADPPPRFTTSRDGAVLPLPDEEDAFFFAIFGDRTEEYRVEGRPSGLKILRQAVTDVNHLEPDLVMTVGDLVQGYNTTEPWLEQMREYKGIMNRLLCAWFPVAGNHDIYWRGPDRPAGEHEADYETHFGPLWYAFTHKKCWFIVLYSDEGNPLVGQRSFSNPDAQKMSPEQFAWLRETLRKAAEASHVFVFVHHPRWTGGQYGDDWEKVHRALVAADNVRAVFGGHIHRMRYDPRDGIEYVTLATTGGSQTGAVPEAGYLHHFNIVTVRPDHISMAAIPVGEVMDVRKIANQVAVETRQLQQQPVEFPGALRIEATGRVHGKVQVTVSNPTSRPVECTLRPESADSRWLAGPDHAHRVIKPGKSWTLPFRVDRHPAPLDGTFRPLEVVIDMDYLADGARFTIPSRRAMVPLRPELPPLTGTRPDQVMVFDGNDALLVADDPLDVPDGPLTLECRFNGRTFRGRRGLVTKTGNSKIWLSEYRFFVSNGVPSFSILIGERYLEVAAPEPVLETGRWYHLAGVYDGVEARLYLDGRPVASAARCGVRRTNRFPLVVGADVGGNGQPTNFFDGAIDDVRLSTVARYNGPFTPPVDLEADADTALLLTMDARLSLWVYDRSPSSAHPMCQGDPVLEATP